MVVAEFPAASVAVTWTGKVPEIPTLDDELDQVI